MRIIAKIKENIKLEIKRFRFRLNIRHSNKTRLERFRVTTKLALLGILIITADYQLAENITQPMRIVIYNDVINAENTPIVVSTAVEGVPTGGESIATYKSPGGVEKLIAETFPEDSKTAIAVFKAESGLNPNTESWTDKMPDGRPFSVGLAQINLTWHELAGIKCYEAFNGRNYEAVVINEPLYEKCVQLAKDPKINLETAKKISSTGRGWNNWATYSNNDYLKYLK